MSALGMGEGKDFSNYAVEAGMPHGGVVYNWNAIGDLKNYTGTTAQWSSIQQVKEEIATYNTVIFAPYGEENCGTVRLQVDADGNVFFIAPDNVRMTLTQTGLKGAMSDTFFPVGSILAFAGITTPSGWLWCNGAAVSRVTYSTLFTICGIAYGKGDGFTTFNLPDFRNRVLEGGATMDVRSYIEAGLPSMVHNHGGTVGSNGAHTHSVSTNSTGAHTHTRGTMNITGTFNGIEKRSETHIYTGAFYDTGKDGLGTGSNDYDNAVNGFDASRAWTGATSSAGAHSHTGTAASNGAHNHSVSIANNANSGLYGKSNTVQPAACTCNYIIKF